MKKFTSQGHGSGLFASFHLTKDSICAFKTESCVSSHVAWVYTPKDQYLQDTYKGKNISRQTKL